MSYCPTTGKSHHASSCYSITRVCTQTEHTHDYSIPGACFNREGGQKCRYQEHTHVNGPPCNGAVGPLCGGTP